MDSGATIDVVTLGLILLAYAAVGLLWLSIALRTNRRD